VAIVFTIAVCLCVLWLALTSSTYREFVVRGVALVLAVCAAYSIYDKLHAPIWVRIVLGLFVVVLGYQVLSLVFAFLVGGVVFVALFALFTRVWRALTGRPNRPDG